MNFYRRRPLTLAISLCLPVSAAMAFVPGAFKLVLILLTVVFTVSAIIYLRRRGTYEICNLSSVGFAGLCGGLMLCFLLTSFAYYDMYARRFEDLENGALTGVVTEVKSQTPYSALYIIETESLDGEDVRGKGIVYTAHPLSLTVGDVITACVEFVPLDEFYGDIGVSKLEMLTRGYVFSCSTLAPAARIGTKNVPSVWLSGLRDTLSAKLRLTLNGEAAAMADALLLGDRSGLGRVRRDFSEIGTVHILALSGMHIAILIGGADRLLRLLGLGRRIRYPILILFMAFYTAVTGFLLSAVRASVMLAITFVADAIGEESDRTTSLFAAAGLIILADPVSVYDVSLQLSFFATLGMTLVSEADARLYADGCAKGGRAYGRRLLGNGAASVGALIFVLPLQWMYFGKISLVCVPATMIISAVCEGILLLLPLQLFCSLIGWYFMSARISFLVGLLTRLASAVAGVLADAFPSVSFKYPFVPVLLVCLITVLAVLVYKNAGNWLYSLIPLAVCTALFLGGVGVYEFAHRSDAEVFCIANGGEGLAVVSERKTMIIDVTGGLRIPITAVWDEAESRCLTSVDTYLITNLTRKHVGSFRSFVGFTPVKNICVPAPETEYELYLAEDLRAVAEEYGAGLTFYTRSTDIQMSFGDVSVFIPKREFIARAKMPLESVTVSRGDSSVSYVGAAVWENTGLWEECLKSDVLLFGSAGPWIHTPPPLGDCRSGQRVHIPELGYAGLADGAHMYRAVSVTVGKRFAAELPQSD